MAISTHAQRTAVALDESRCVHCRACLHECPAARFHAYARIDQVTVEQCIGCGHCLAVCPTDVLTHASIARKALRQQPAPLTPEASFIFHANRHSTREFIRRPVETGYWQALLEAMRLAPSGMNARPVQAAIVTDPATVAAISAQTVALFRKLMRLAGTPLGRLILSLLAGREATKRLVTMLPELSTIAACADAGGDPILHNAPGVLILHADRCAPTAHDDCLLAAMAAMLHAPTLGLGTCLIGFTLPAFQRLRPLRALIDLPTGHEVYAVLAVGYPATRFLRLPPRSAIPVRWV